MSISTELLAILACPSEDHAPLRLESVPAASRTHSHTIESGRLGSKEAEIDMEAEKAMLLLKVS